MIELPLLHLLISSLGLPVLLLSERLRSRRASFSQQQEEEERLTPYESKDIHPTAAPESGTTRLPKPASQSGWEFKIVRATQDLFRDPATFRQLCEEEAQVGWILLEKLDDRRVRFKRPIALREIIKSENLSFDPYRTQYGSAGSQTQALTAIAFLAAVLLPGYLGYVLVTKTLATTRSNVPATAPPAFAPRTVPPRLDQMPDLNKRRLNNSTTEPASEN